MDRLRTYAQNVGGKKMETSHLIEVELVKCSRCHFLIPKNTHCTICGQELPYKKEVSYTSTQQ